MNRKLKNFLIIAGSIAAIVFLIAIFGVATDGFKTFSDMSLTTVNPDNLICVDDYVLVEINDDKDTGYTIDITDKGEIIIKGENEAETDAKIAVQAVTLKAEEYTITSNADCSSKTYFVTIENADGSVVFDADDTFEVEEAGEYTVYINILAGEKIDDSFEIVLVPGDKEAPFFVVK